MTYTFDEIDRMSIDEMQKTFQNKRLRIFLNDEKTITGTLKCLSVPMSFPKAPLSGIKTELKPVGILLDNVEIQIRPNTFTSVEIIED